MGRKAAQLFVCISASTSWPQKYKLPEPYVCRRFFGWMHAHDSCAGVDVPLSECVCVCVPV